VTGHAQLALAILVQEMVLAARLIANRFGPSAVRTGDMSASEPAITALDGHAPVPAWGGRRSMDTRKDTLVGSMSARSEKSPPLPPRWFIRLFWVMQRAVYSLTGGRLGLRTATAHHQGMMRLRTVGRRTGEERTAILAYFEDGPDLVTMAMNGWADAEPAWWLNLQAHPDVTVDLPGGPRAVRGRAANADERPRLWARWAVYDKDLDAFAARRSRETAVVILSRRPA
jgi:F420H(2)-dependent quinone reductase